MTEVWQLYDRYSAEFDRARGRALIERRYLDAVTVRLKAGARVLDLGCGSGEPIARFFIERGYAVTGVDAAPAMIAMCRARFPDAAWITADMRGLDLGQRFDAIVAWDSFFHLDAAAQRAMFPVFARHAAPGAALLFTSGPAAGEALGDFHGQTLFHASLDAAEYVRLLTESGFVVRDHKVEDPDCGGHTVWLAQAAA